ncbi:MAG: glycerophosphoryl diester phosphodiesterase membrane domain-containing protein [Kaiparowitsia implicata GSE-PSE-MK54-09C]|nr:glycerophosphoryl diester phosphodiesterase membrane domain-containing protein [Kaiparowitsia implicata GSE-PSE-MK54-09C]
MTSGLDSQDLLHPLTIGNIVNAGLRLYKQQFKPYLGVAALSTLWLIVPFGVAIALAIGFLALSPDSYSLLGLIIPAWLVLFFYCLGRYLANAAAISRLAYQELIHQPESVQAARRYTNLRQRSFLGANLLIGLIYMTVFITMYLVGTVSIAFLFVATGGLAFLQNPGSALLVNPFLMVFSVLIVVAAVLLQLLIACWFWVRFAIAELPLAIEPATTVTQSIGRSWTLTRRNVWRIFMVLLITLLITLPVQIVAQSSVGLVNGAVAAFLPEDSGGFLVVSQLILVTLGLVISIVLLPLWQTIKAVIYYDLRSRHEGLDLVVADLPVDS